MTAFDLPIEHDTDLDPSAPALERHAVRAVVRRGDVLLLMRTAAGAWKFPGGGVEDGESDEAALRREVAEECGTVAVVAEYLGRVVERGAAHPEDPAPVFVQVSRYYACTVDEVGGPGELTPSERALGLEAQWVRLDQAIAANRARIGAHRFVRRELLVLEHLLPGPG